MNLLLNKRENYRRGVQTANTPTAVYSSTPQSHVLLSVFTCHESIIVHVHLDARMLLNDRQFNPLEKRWTIPLPGSNVYVSMYRM